ncbi:MAG: EF-P beta-lysylation protein EpmB [Thiomargarita sp.]|nr:EF-P beta-lysylation protein EpmB [Thiomargarita sp.]
MKTIHHWTDLLSQTIFDYKYLLKILELPADLPIIESNFSLKVPKSYVNRMRKSDFNDPLLRQILPLIAEKHLTSECSTDPVGDKMAEKIPGLLHKYQGRALWLITNACAIHCRYCFRQHFNYKSSNQAVLEAIKTDSSLTEIILSGGDPLMLNDRYLAKLIKKLSHISHVKRLRIHTRMPIVLPERINLELLNWLKDTDLQIIMVVHANHPNEINAQVGYALQQLINAKITVLNQTVLLRGINDNITALTQLSEVLFEQGVLPYYLHLLDCVQGASHFAVEINQALSLLEQLQIRLPGYLVPKLVKEIAGMPYKKLVLPLN